MDAETQLLFENFLKSVEDERKATYKVAAAVDCYLAGKIDRAELEQYSNHLKELSKTRALNERLYRKGGKF